MHPKTIEFYAENRFTLIDTDQQLLASDQDERLKLAYQLCLSVKGLNPKNLARFPKALQLLESTLKKKWQDSLLVETLSLMALQICHALQAEAKALGCGSLPPSDVESLIASLEKLAMDQAKNDQESDRMHKAMQRVMIMLESVEECIVCLDEQATTFFQCGHRVCGQCSPKLKQCPFCRVHILRRYHQQNQGKMDLEDITEEEEESLCPPPHLPTFSLVRDADAFLRKRFEGLVMRTSVLDALSKEELKVLCQREPVIQELFFKLVFKIRSEETLAYIAAKLFNQLVPWNKKSEAWSNQEIQRALKFLPHLSNPNRLFRFLAILDGKERFDLKERIKFKPSNGMRRFLVLVINHWQPDHALIFIKRRPGIWRHLFRLIHIGHERFSKFSNARLLADVVRENVKTKLDVPMAIWNRFYMASDPAVFEVMKANPGIGFRTLRSVVLRLSSKVTYDTLVWKTKELLECFSPSQLFELAHILSVKDASEEARRVFRVKNGVLSWLEQAPPKLADALREAILDNIFLQLAKIQLPGCLVIQDAPAMERVLLPRGGTPSVPAWVQQVVTAGDRLKIDEDSEVVLFIYWTNTENDDRVDLDLSLMIFDEAGIFVDKVDYITLKDYTELIQHSGDITNAPYGVGAAEYISFHPKSLLKYQENHQKDYSIGSLSVVCFSYNSVAFDSMGYAMVGIGIRDEDAKGLGPYGSHVLAACQLRGNSTVNLAGVFHLRESEFLFCNTNIKMSLERINYSVSNCREEIALVMSRFVDWSIYASPPSFLAVANLMVLNHSKVRFLVEGGGVDFERQPTETPLEFRKRVLSTKKEANAVALEKLETPDEVPYLFFGNELPANLPDKSTVVSKKDLHVPVGSVWTTDPYSVFLGVGK